MVVGGGGGNLWWILRDTAVRTNKLFSFRETYLPRSPDSVERGNKLVLWISRVCCRRLIDVCTPKALGARDRDHNSVASLAAAVYPYRFVIPITRFKTKRSCKCRVPIAPKHCVTVYRAHWIQNVCPAGPVRVRFNFYPKTHNCRNPLESSVKHKKQIKIFLQFEKRIIMDIFLRVISRDEGE